MIKSSFNPIDERDKVSISSELHTKLIDSIDLRHQIKLAHWNLRDKDFIAIHRFFDEIGATVLEGSDLIAERIRQLGTVVTASTAEVAKESSLKAFPKGLLDGKTAITALCEAMSQMISGLHDSIAKIDEKRDAITVDMLTQISRSLEVQLWFLESHLP